MVGVIILVVNSGLCYCVSWGFYDYFFDVSYGMMMDYYGVGWYVKVWSMVF